MSMQQPFIPGLANYKGFAVAAITENIKDSDYAKWSIDALPNIISYDQYVGVYAIAASSHSDGNKKSQISAMFRS